jgi:septum formation protein
LEFETVPAPVDEDLVKQSMRAEGASASDIAARLAELKAIRVSERHPGAVVVGADQTLSLNGETLDKPVSMDEAASHLRRLAGGTHTLPTAVVIAEAGRSVWRKIVTPKVSFRPFSEEFIASYLAHMGERALGSVGACEVEGRGAQLVSRIDGDFFAVLGLPLLEMLDYLRVRGVIST